MAVSRGKVVEPEDFANSGISYEMALAASRVVAQNSLGVEDARSLMEALGTWDVLCRHGKVR